MRDPWSEGKYVDLWSLVHLLAGFHAASLLRLVGLSLFWTGSITLLALAAYEVVEKVANVEEHATNRLTDIVFGIAGAAISLEVAQADPGRFVYVASTVVFTMLNFLGWRAWRKRERGL